MMQEYNEKILNQSLKKFEEATARLKESKTLENAQEVHSMSLRGMEFLFLIEKEDGTVPREYKEHYCRVASEALRTLKAIHPPKVGSPEYETKLRDYNHMKYWASLMGIRLGTISDPRKIRFH